jgi:hypothetical protein
MSSKTSGTNGVGDAGGVVCDPQRSGFLCELDSREYVSNHSSRETWYHLEGGFGLDLEKS